MMHETTILRPQALCETRNGDLAYAVGRLAFRKGRPMLVEHICGAFLAHDFGGQVITPGFGSDFDIMVSWMEMEENEKDKDKVSGAMAALYGAAPS